MADKKKEQPKEVKETKINKENQPKYIGGKL